MKVNNPPACSKFRNFINRHAGMIDELYLKTKNLRQNNRPPSSCGLLTLLLNEESMRDCS